MSEQTERADKFLWSVRLFKTRSKATEACKKKQVLINDLPIKASKLLQAGDEFKIKHPPVFKVYTIKEILHNRVGAKLVPDYLKDIWVTNYIKENLKIKLTIAE